MRERHRERYGASRRLFTQRFHAGLSYAAPPFEPAAGSFSGQNGAGGLVGCLSHGGVYGNEVTGGEVQTDNG